MGPKELTIEPEEFDRELTAALAKQAEIDAENAQPEPPVGDLVDLLGSTSIAGQTPSQPLADLLGVGQPAGQHMQTPGASPGLLDWPAQPSAPGTGPAPTGNLLIDLAPASSNAGLGTNIPGECCGRRVHPDARRGSVESCALLGGAAIYALHAVWGGAERQHSAGWGGSRLMPVCRKL